MTGRPVLRVDQDIGLLSNVRMGVEVAVGLAYLSNRRLAMPDVPILGAPVSSITGARRGQPATVKDLFDLPIEMVDPLELNDADLSTTEELDIGAISDVVIVVDDVDPCDPMLREFANGRTQMMVPPSSDAHVLYLRGRLLSFYSYCFFATGHQRRALWAFIQGVRPRRPYAALGARIARDLSGPFNAVHLRRSDLIIGIREYAGVSGAAIANNLAEVLPADETLLVCSEVDESDALFHPLRQRFNNIVFANTLILEEHRTTFFDLPRHEDNALGVVTQELAARSSTFVGTAGSTFTGMIQRAHLLREPEMKFLYTADYTPPGPRFERGQYLDRFDGAFSWNRIGYEISPTSLTWFREWPEAA